MVVVMGRAMTVVMMTMMLERTHGTWLLAGWRVVY